MTVYNVHQALSQVRELRQRVLENQQFRGYSAAARAAGGVLALIGAAALDLPWYPRSTSAHAIGWGIICAAALALNYGAVALWYYRKEDDARRMVSLRPALDPLPGLAAGAILTAALLARDGESLLFGAWMCLYGVINLSSRRSLPREAGYVGWYYLACGAVCLLAFPAIAFTNPWPMGVVFFTGEIAGSVVFQKIQQDQPQ